MARRTGWRRLSESYRSRLLGAGRSGRLSGAPMTAQETQRYWQAGGPLQQGRSHAMGARRAKTAAPGRATRLEMAGEGTSDSYSELVRWRRKRASAGGPPRWIPRDEVDMRTDTAAILSQIDIPPERWATVDFTWLGRRGPITMTITSTRGAVRTVTLQDADQISELARWIRHLEYDGIEVNVHGSPGAGGKAA